MGRNINLSSLQKLLVYSLRDSSSPLENVNLLTPLKEPLDWDNLLAEANRHGVLPFFYQFLETLDSGLVPEAVKERMKNACLVGLTRTVAFSDELEKILQRFNKEEIEIIVLKGPVNSEKIYLKSGLRHYRDLDLLVRKENLDQAVQALKGLGYRQLGEDQHLFEKEGRTQFHFQKRGAMIDLHWDLINYGSYREGISLSLKEIWSKAQPITFGSQRALTLSVEDLIIYQCLHVAAHHAFEKLIWFKDIDQTLLRYKDQFSWDHLISRAETMHIKTYVYYALYFTEGLLGTDIPKAVLEELRTRYILAKIFEFFCFRKSLLDLSKDNRSPAHQVWKVLRDEQKERFRAIASRIFPPVDWYLHSYPFLPKMKRSCYYLSYPLLMGVRLLKRPLGSSRQ